MKARSWSEKNSNKKNRMPTLGRESGGGEGGGEEHDDENDYKKKGQEQKRNKMKLR